MIEAVVDFCADVMNHFYIWMSAIRFGAVSAWDIFLASFAVALIFKGLHAMFFKEEE